jgi:hypothetical protein
MASQSLMNAFASTAVLSWANAVWIRYSTLNSARGVPPVNYFFCEDELSAELIHLFGWLTNGQKRTIIPIIKETTK